jgi:hypothetical protein
LSTTLREPALATLDDDAWDHLLSFIEEHRVILIVGLELLQVAQRERFARNHEDAPQRLDYASALYALTLTGEAHRDELLQQASAIIAVLSAEMQLLKSTRMWGDRIAAERGKSPPSHSHSPS